MGTSMIIFILFNIFGTIGANQECAPLESLLIPSINLSGVLTSSVTSDRLFILSGHAQISKTYIIYFILRIYYEL